MRIKELIAKLKSFRLSKKILLVSAKCFNLVVSNPSQSSPSFCVDQFVASTFPPSLPPPAPARLRHLNLLRMSSFKLLHTHRAKTVSKCFAQLPDFMAFFFNKR